MKTEVDTKKMLSTVVLLLLSLATFSVAETSDKQSAAAAAAAAAAGASSSSNLDDFTAQAAAEFRQAGGGGAALGQQLLNSYQGAYSSSGYPYMASAATGGANGAYGGMLRQMYRPQSIGLTDKVRNWVKSFLNRRQYVKPYYNPSGLLGYGADSSKPIYINGASYKPISVPLRQLQKYFKPFYGASGSSANAESAAQNAVMAQYLAAAAGMNPSAGSGFSYGDASGLYASESAGGPIFNPGAGNGGSFYAGSSGINGFGGGNGPLSSGTSGAFGSATGDSAFSPTSNVYSASGLYGSSGTGGSEYFGGNAGGQGNGGSFYGSVFGPGGTDDLTATSSSHFSSSTVNGYYPQQGGSGVRTSDMQFSGSNGPHSVQGSSHGYNFETGAGSYPVESTYSLSYQRPPPQNQHSYSGGGGGGGGGPSNFQPVQFSGSHSNEGSHKSQSGSGGNAGHSSSSSSSLYASEKSS